jgi:hypothetical protein
MGLYDSFKQQNSTEIPKFQGSLVPDLINVSGQLQQTYDQSQNNIDYADRLLNSLGAHPNDKSQLSEWAKGIKSKLEELSARPDLENALRETTMMAKRVPDEYAGFAARIKDFQEYQDKLDKGVEAYNKGEKGGISPETKRRLLETALYQDAQAGGIKKDATTGKYTGRFTGIDFVNDLDTMKFADEAMANVKPGVIKGEVVKLGDQWVVKTGNTTRSLTKEEIDKIMGSAYETSGHWKQWVNQENFLKSYKTDYSKIKESDLKLDSVISSKTEKNAKGKLVQTPVTLKEYIEQAKAQGISVGEAVKNLQRAQTEQEFRRTTSNYAHKYRINEQENTVDYNANQYGVERFKKDQDKVALQMATTMTLGGADVKDVKDFDNVVNTSQEAINSAKTRYQDWFNGRSGDGNKKTRLPDGRIVYTDKNGKQIDVTADAKEMLSSVDYAVEKKQQLHSIEEAAKRASKYTGPPEQNKPEIARNNAEIQRLEKEFDGKSGERVGLAAMGKIQALKERNQKLLGPLYNEYQKELTKRMTGTTVGSDLFGFLNEKNVKAISSQVEAVVSGLGVEKGLVPVTIGHGADKGKQLSKDEWEELKGNMQVIGVTITGNPQSPLAMVVRAFKDTKGKKTEGEDMVVQLPNTNIEELAKDNMSKQQYYYLQKSAGLAKSLDANGIFSANGIEIRVNKDDSRQGFKVKRGNKERTLGSFKDVIDYLDNVQ